jgi:hypothetical protein
VSLDIFRWAVEFDHTARYGLAVCQVFVHAYDVIAVGDAVGLPTDCAAPVSVMVGSPFSRTVSGIPALARSGLVAHCAATVASSIMLAIIHVESNGNPFAIGDNAMDRSYYPRNRVTAGALARRLSRVPAATVPKLQIVEKGEPR